MLSIRDLHAGVGDKRNVAVSATPAPLKSEQADSVADALRVVAKFLADEIP